MNKATKQTTIHLEADVYQVLEDKAVLTSQSLSSLVNQALRDFLYEDLEDLAAFEQRANEPTLSEESLRKKLKAGGRR